MVVDRRRGDDRQQVGELGERLRRRRASPRRPRGARACSSSAARPARRRGARQQAVDEVAVAGVGRHAAGRRVRVREQARAPRARRARCGRSTGPRSMSGSAASAFEPTGWPVAAKQSTTLRSSSSWRGVSTRQIGRGGPAGASSASALRMICLPALLGLGRDARVPSSPTSLTRAVTVISCSGRPRPRNWTLRRCSASGPAGRLRHARARPGPSSTGRAGCARAGRPRGELLVDVDRVEVARRARVADGQVLVRRDPQLRRRRPGPRPPTPRTMLVHSPRRRSRRPGSPTCDSKTKKPGRRAPSIDRDRDARGDLVAGDHERRPR